MIFMMTSILAVNYDPILTQLNPKTPTIPAVNIMASSGTGGSISPSGTVSVNFGENQSFAITQRSVPDFKRGD